MARHRGVDRAHVFDAGAAALGELGWSGLTMAAVAESLGVRVPSLYHHVSGLDELRAALQCRAMEALASSLREAAMGRSGAEGLRAIVQAQRAFARANPELYLAATREPLDRDAFFRAALPALDVFLAMAGRAIDDPGALQHAASTFAGFHGPIVLEVSAFFGAPVDLDAVFDEVTDRLCRTFVSEVA